MSVKASEISDLIKTRIENFKSAAEARSITRVVERNDLHQTSRASPRAPSTKMRAPSGMVLVAS